jgi:hypothetical protein
MEHKILVYGKCGGYVTIATFLGNQWWVTNKDERLEPLYSGELYDQSDYRYLSEVGELVQMRDLAGMMGCALQYAEDDIKDVLNNRLKDLNMMGVKFVSSAQYLNIGLSVSDNKGTCFKGKYRVLCSDTDRDMMLFNVDSFDNAKDALNWAKVFVDFFLKHGVRVCVTLHCTEDVLELLNGQVQNMKIEIDNL